MMTVCGFLGEAIKRTDEDIYPGYSELRDL